MSMPKELLRKIYVVELVTRRKIRNLYPGAHKSVSLGQGFDFEDYREYSPGDDVRNIDQYLLARIPEKAYIKRFREEKQLTVWILADLSNSMRFGFKDLTKKELLIKSAAQIGFSAVHEQDLVGLMIFTNKIETMLMPKNGRSWLVYLLNRIWDFSGSSETDIISVLKKARNYFRKSAMIVLLSDFLDENCFKENSVFWKEIRTLATVHDLVPVVFGEDSSFLLEAKGNIRLRDLESGKEISFYLSEKNREELSKELEKRRRILRDRFMKAGARAIFEAKEEDLDKFLKFFLYRKRGKV